MTKIEPEKIVAAVVGAMLRGQGAEKLDRCGTKEEAFTIGVGLGLMILSDVQEHMRGCDALASHADPATSRAFYLALSELDNAISTQLLRVLVE